MDSPGSEFDPFNPILDESEQKDALTEALRRVQGFALYFVVSDPVRVRPRLMSEVAEQLNPRRIQSIYVTQDCQNLLHLLRQQLESPLPDVVFVDGLENGIASTVPTHTIPFLLNLNAARNHFYHLLSRPLVLWVSQYILTAIANAAPDFLSVRSGVYAFSLSPEERAAIRGTLTALTWMEMQGMGEEDTGARIQELEKLLAEYSQLPETKLNMLDITRLQVSLAGLYGQLGQRGTQEKLLREALAVERELLPANHPRIATVLNNLANVYLDDGYSDAAEALFQESLEIRRQSLSENHPRLITILNSLAEIYRDKEEYDKAEALYNEALSIARQNIPAEFPLLALTLNNIAQLRNAQNRYGEASQLLTETLEINRRFLPPGHRNIIRALNNLAVQYENTGDYASARNYFEEAAALSHSHLGDADPLTEFIVANQDEFLNKNPSSPIQKASPISQ